MFQNPLSVWQARTMPTSPLVSTALVVTVALALLSRLLGGDVGTAALGGLFVLVVGALSQPSVARTPRG